MLSIKFVFFFFIKKDSSLLESKLNKNDIARMSWMLLGMHIEMSILYPVFCAHVLLD